MISTGHLSPQPKRHLNRFSRFCTDDRRVSLYFTMGRPSPLKIVRFHGRPGPPSNTWFLGPTRVLDPNGISIGAAVFAWLTSVTDRQSVTTGRFYVRSARCGLTMMITIIITRNTGTVYTSAKARLASIAIRIRIRI